MKKRKIAVVLCVVILSIAILYQAIKSINSDNEIEPSTESEQRKRDVFDEAEGEEGTGIKQEEIHNLVDNAGALTGELYFLEEYEDDLKKLNIYENSSINIDSEYVDTMIKNLKDAGWNELECSILKDSFFTLKCNEKKEPIVLSDEDYLELTVYFLKDSGLKNFFEKEGIEYQLQTVTDSQLTVTYCYLMCEGQTTGSYLRFVYEDSYFCGECQANLYRSECIASAEMYPLEEALEHAFYINEAKNGSADTDDYNVNNIKIVYVNGLPYYHFIGLGIDNRSAIDGYALAVKLNEVDIDSEVLEKKVKTFHIGE